MPQFQKRWTAEDDQKLERDYPHKGPRLLALEMGRTYRSVERRAQRKSLFYKNKREDQSRSRTMNNDSVDIHYFDEWSVNGAYLLGFIQADGSLTYSREGKYRLRFNNKVEDSDILEKIKRELKATQKLADDDRRKEGKTHCKRLVIGSKYLVGLLMEKYGILPKKSQLNLPWRTIPSEYFPHFARGWLDGDGSVKGSGNSKGPHWYARKQYLEGFREQLLECLDIKPNTVCHSSSGIWVVGWRAKKDVEKLYHWLYPEGDYLYGRRKRRALEALL